MGIWNSGLRAVRTGINHIKPSNNIGAMAPARKLARQTAIETKYLRSEGIATGAARAEANLDGIAEDIAEQTTEMVEKMSKQAMDKEMARMEKGFIGRHPIIATGAAAGGVAAGYQMFKGDNNGVSPSAAYDAGAMAAQQDVANAMMAANINAAPTAMAGNIDYQGRVESQERAIG